MHEPEQYDSSFHSQRLHDGPGDCDAGWICRLLSGNVLSHQQVELIPYGVWAAGCAVPGSLDLAALGRRLTLRNAALHALLGELDRIAEVAPLTLFGGIAMRESLYTDARHRPVPTVDVLLAPLAFPRIAQAMAMAPILGSAVHNAKSDSMSGILASIRVAHTWLRLWSTPFTGWSLKPVLAADLLARSRALGQFRSLRVFDPVDGTVAALLAQATGRDRSLLWLPDLARFSQCIPRSIWLERGRELARALGCGPTLNAQLSRAAEWLPASLLPAQLPVGMS